MIAPFYTTPLTPATTCHFERELRGLLDECGRLILQTVYNHLEPENPQDAPKHSQRDRQDYVRKNSKTLNRGGIATLFGTIQLQRCLYEPLQDARDDDQPSFAPLERHLGIVAGNATPALAERVGRLAAQQTQQEMLQWLQREHHVRLVGRGSAQRYGGGQRRYRRPSAGGAAANVARLVGAGASE